MRTLTRALAAGVLTLIALSTANAATRATCRIVCTAPNGSTAFVDVPGVTQQDCCGGAFNFSAFCPVPGSTSYGAGWNHSFCLPS